MPGYAGAPLLQLSGSFAGATASGLVIGRGNVVVKGFAINGFGEYGISMLCPGSASCGDASLSLYGSYIGTMTDAATAFPNKNGIFLVTDNDDQVVSNIGGTAANHGNVISGNQYAGIVINASQYLNDVKIVNNRIGTNAAGNAAVPNGTNGIFLFRTSNISGLSPAPDILIGGANAVERNIISGNGANGIQINENSFDISIRGNYIGTNAAGTADLGNGQNGIMFDESFTGDGMVVGGKAAGEGNLISGNNLNGIKSGTHSIGIFGNRIGTNAAGTGAIPNAEDGIYLSNKALIGDTLTNGGNTISGNGDDGIHVANTSFPSLIWGNRIGVNLAGTAAIPNGKNGVRLNGRAKVGASGATQYNIIAGNTENGIFITGGAGESEIKYNRIGTNAAGANLGNGADGIRVFSQVSYINVGDTEGGGNIIAFNNGDGIFLQPGFGAAVPDTVLMVGNSIYSNDGLGIDLGPVNGVTPNDLGDNDAGPNELLNFPILQIAAGNFINGTFNGGANKYYTIDFYRADSCDASGNGEGRYYLGSRAIQTNANGSMSFNATGFNMNVGQIIVATATELEILSGSRTSEFSPCLTVTTPPGDVKLNSATYSASESNAGLAVIVTRNGGSNGTITVNYATSDGTATAGQDYTATSGTLTFNNGETGKLITIPLIDDASDEPDETFNITLSNPTGGATLANPSSAVLTVTDNDNPPQVSIKNFSDKEGNSGTKNFVFDVNLSAASSFPVSVKWNTSSDGMTATAGVDYVAADGTLNFAPGEIFKQVTVLVNGDLITETNESFQVLLYAPVNTTVSDGHAVGGIHDDDNPGKLGFSLSAYNVNENIGSAIVTVSRTDGTTGTVNVSYATTNDGTATTGIDFTAASGTLTFLDGETAKTFMVSINDDQNAEQTEWINLVLSSSIGGATLGTNSSLINITDNDSAALAEISGVVNYGVTTVNQSPKAISGVVISAAGDSTSSATTDSAGNYSLNNLATTGQFTVTPSKTGDVNGINSLDATRIQQHIVGLINLTPNQLIAADTDGNGKVNSLDATRIQQYLVGIQSTNIIGQWKFLPGNKQYGSINSNLTGENYQAILVGEVSGNWTNLKSFAADSQSGEEEISPAIDQTVNDNAARFKRETAAAQSMKQSTDSKAEIVEVESAGLSVPVFLPGNAAEAPGATVTIPVSIGRLPSDTSIESFDFSVFYDPAVLQPTTPSAGGNTGTLSSQCSVFANSPSSGTVIVSGACGNPPISSGSDTLYNLTFTVIGSGNRQTQLSFTDPVTMTAEFRLNNGTSVADTADGQFTALETAAASITVSGRAINDQGRGIGNVTVTMTDANGAERTTQTNDFGYYQFEAVPKGETVTISAKAKRYRFSQPSIVRTTTGPFNDADFFSHP